MKCILYLYDLTHTNCSKLNIKINVDKTKTRLITSRNIRIIWHIFHLKPVRYDVFKIIDSLYLYNIPCVLLVRNSYLVALLFLFQNQRLKNTQSCWQIFSFFPVFFILFIRQEQPLTLNQPYINGNEGSRVQKCPVVKWTEKFFVKVINFN